MFAAYSSSTMYLSNSFHKKAFTLGLKVTEYVQGNSEMACSIEVYQVHVMKSQLIRHHGYPLLYSPLNAILPKSRFAYTIKVISPTLSSLYCLHFSQR